jgi:hypothetical protein
MDAKSNKKMLSARVVGAVLVAVFAILAVGCSSQKGGGTPEVVGMVSE